MPRAARNLPSKTTFEASSSGLPPSCPQAARIGVALKRRSKTVCLRKLHYQHPRTIQRWNFICDRTNPIPRRYATSQVGSMVGIGVQYSQSRADVCLVESCWATKSAGSTNSKPNRAKLISRHAVQSVPSILIEVQPASFSAFLRTDIGRNGGRYWTITTN